MICKICGGVLRADNNGKYICDNCGNSYPVLNYFENVDAVIFCVDIDAEGRKTKDGIVAQKIYNNLCSAGINVFYPNIESDVLFEKDRESIIANAKNQAKVLILVGSTREHFEKLVLENQEVFNYKKIIPVCINMDLYKLPEEISSVQALNYDKIGAEENLTKMLLTYLQKNDSSNLFLGKKNKGRKMGMFLSVMACIVLLTIILAISYIFPGKRIEKAEQYINNQNYEKAIDILSKNSNYDGAYDMLKSVYFQYSGYYENHENAISLYLHIGDNSIANVKLSSEKMNLMLDDTVKINKNAIELHYEDKRINLKLENEGINLEIYNEENAEDCFNCYFQLKDKRDTPMQKSVDENMLLEWCNQKLTVDDIEGKGYELKKVSEYDEFTSLYKIENTGICLYMSALDFSLDNDMEQKYDNVIKNEHKLAGIEIPKNMLDDSHISENGNPYIKNDVFYWINGKIAIFHGFEYDDETNSMKKYAKDIIYACEGDGALQSDDKDVNVVVIGKNSVSKDNWDYLIELAK